MDSTPRSARCRITADGRYELWLNGTWVGRGPERSEPSLLSYDAYDITPLLRQGLNVIAVWVRHYARPTLWWCPSQPEGELGFGSLLFDATIRAAGRDITVSSGAGWKGRWSATRTVESASAGVRFVPPPTEGPPPLEMVDGPAVPWGWTEPSYDDGEWSEAYVLQEGSFQTLEPRGSHPLTTRTIVPKAMVGSGPAGALHEHPLTAIDGDHPGRRTSEDPRDGSLSRGRWLTFDMGEIVNAHPFIELDAEAGGVFDLSCGEDLMDDGRPVTAPREWAMRVVAGGRKGERHDSFEAVGFRYLSVAARTESAASLNVGAIEMLAPRSPGAYFRCSDPMLDEIWRAGARSLDLCSTDAFIDCPGREQRAWLGDIYVTAAVRSVLDPDASLTKRMLQLHARGARPDGLLPMVAAGDFTYKRATIPDSTLLWVATLRAHYERTGDLSLVTELLPIAERSLQWFERFRSPDGLLEDVPGWIFIDWAQIERGPSIAALDALYVWALRSFAELCDVVGNHGSAARARIRAEHTRAAFELYWDEERGVYRDALGPGIAGRISQQTNAIAIVADCASPERWGRMLSRICDADRLRRTLTPGDPGSFGERMNRQWEEPPGFDNGEDVVLAQPFFTHFLHRALDRAGKAADVIPSIRRWKPLVERGNGCFEEYWDAEPGLGSRCHAWSATPVFDLAEIVLGVRGARPGMKVVRVEPNLGDLTWAEGAVATPAGFIEVRAERGKAPVARGPDSIEVLVPEGAGGSPV